VGARKRALILSAKSKGIFYEFDGYQGVVSAAAHVIERYRKHSNSPEDDRAQPGTLKAVGSFAVRQLERAPADRTSPPYQIQ
jgi:hypothetical protein